MIDATRPDAIASMLRTLETYADQAKGPTAIQPPAPDGVDFGAAVKSAVDQVNATQMRVYPEGRKRNELWHRKVS